MLYREINLLSYLKYTVYIVVIAVFEAVSHIAQAAMSIPGLCPWPSTLHPPISTSQVLELQACAVMSINDYYLNFTLPETRT